MCAYMMQLDDDNIFQAVQRLSYSHSANCASQTISLNEPLQSNNDFNTKEHSDVQALGTMKYEYIYRTACPMRCSRLEDFSY
jgi:hypothetical protein